MTHPIVEGLTEAVTMAKLMRDLADVRVALGNMGKDMRNLEAVNAVLHRELAEERALADRGRDVVQHWLDHSHHPCQLSDDFLAAYRKARGL